MSTSSTPLTQRPALEQLAALFGVQLSYMDVGGQTQHVSEKSLLAVLNALGANVSSSEDAVELLDEKRRKLAEQGLPTVAVVWENEPLSARLTLPESLATMTGQVTITTEFDKTLLETVDLSTLEPMAVDWSQDPTYFDDSLPEGYVARKFVLDIELPFGYHHLQLEVGGHSWTTQIIYAPLKCFAPTDRVNATKSHVWGVFLPVYSLVTEDTWGAGAYSDLERMAEWSGGLGGGMTGSLPLLSSYLDDPCDPSPYAPVSRLFWNEIYLDIHAIPDYKDCPEAQELVESQDYQDRLREIREKKLVDYRGLMALKREVLELLADKVFRDQGERYKELMQRRESHPLLDDYAQFRATQETTRTSWTDWDEPRRSGQLSESDYDEKRFRYHLYAQFLATEQLAHLSVAAEATGTGLYLDLPLGVRPDGYDVWRFQHVYANGAHIGAPPDMMFTKGQNWGFAPQHPERLREDCYRHVRDYLHHHMQFSRQLRIDHVMCLHRLYWIPEGVSASDGAYVRYRPEEWYAVLAVESHRHEACVIGENLGTVPPGVNEALERHGVAQMFVLQYQLQSDQDDLIGQVPAGCITCINTHDMPPFAAWWEGLDILDRHDLGLIDSETVDREQRERSDLKRQLTRWMRGKRPIQEPAWPDEDANVSAAEVIQALHEFFAASPAEFLIVNQEDLFLETQPQNVPGTTGDVRPNWRRRAQRTFEEFSSDPAVVESLQRIDKLRASRTP
ncbi:4-alpha-glucanotransferase [Thalassoroseus pseudoceratinae]|uniref:4-alpha-glucanotransferase n=1 Tax=Thalassoroseus pseudoceratinae TaxID=2713176 RepID=UPI001423F0A3|nr:4-alpha-glucanotransferase [Thalassoroseus pseudoceratinae]